MAFKSDKYTEAQHDQALLLSKEGMSVPKIGKKTKVNPATVAFWIKRSNGKTQSRGKAAKRRTTGKAAKRRTTGKQAANGSAPSMDGDMNYDGVEHDIAVMLEVSKILRKRPQLQSLFDYLHGRGK